MSGKLTAKETASRCQSQKDGQILSTLEKWRRRAPPKSPDHWADGRSAKELARAWLADKGATMPPEVLDPLAAHPNFGAVQSWQAESEAEQRFDTFAGEPRNGDLAVSVRDGSGPYFLAIGAKADEPFGETVAQIFAAVLARQTKDARSRGAARIEWLAVLLLPPRAKGMPRAADLRY